ncbi:hypothetical protein LP419_36140 [Massilia sp. H-1]|nr:hypothetical protein LP419_36140 [Massilia sp. H-1]
MADLFAMAAASGVASGYVGLIGVAELLVVVGFAWATSEDKLDRPLRIGCGIVTAVLVLALALHKLPGFYNPQLITNVRFSPDALPFTQYANFDKASAGLILLAFLCPARAPAPTGAPCCGACCRSWR